MAEDQPVQLDKKRTAPSVKDETFEEFWAKIRALQVTGPELMSAAEVDAFLYDENGAPH